MVKVKKIKRGVGPEWIGVFIVISLFIALILVLNYYYIRRGEAIKLADNIGNMIVLKETGKTANIKLSDVESVLLQVDQMIKKYGFPNHIIYIKNEPFFLPERTLILTKEIPKNEMVESIFIRFLGVFSGDFDTRENDYIRAGVVLNDGYLYYLDEVNDGSGSYYIKLYKGKIRGGYNKDYFSMPPIFNEGLTDPNIAFYSVSGLQENLFFYPIVSEVKYKENNTLVKNVYNKNNKVSDIFEPYIFNPEDISENITIDRAATRENIQLLVNHYNSMFNGRNFRISFLDEENLSLDDYNETDFTGEYIDADEAQWIRNTEKKINRNKYSFFFYSQKRDNRIIDNLGYRFRAKEEIKKSEDIGVKYLPSNVNSVHLVIESDIFIPLLKDSDGNSLSRVIRFNFDVAATKK